MFNQALRLTRRIPVIGEAIRSVAFPQEAIKIPIKEDSMAFLTKYYDGIIIENHLKGRGGGKYPGKCYRTNLNIGGGASGGPVFCKDGRVFGVNSRTLVGFDDTYVYHIQSIGGLPTLDYTTTKGIKVKNTKITQLVEVGEIASD